MGEVESDGRRPRWHWIVLGVAILVAGARFVFHAIDHDWWKALYDLLFAGFGVVGWNAMIMASSGRFPSNRQWWRTLTWILAIAVAILAVFCGAWIVNGDLSAGVYIWLVIIAIQGIFVPRAYREYQRDPDGSYFKDKYDERQANLWPNNKKRSTVEPPSDRETS